MRVKLEMLTLFIAFISTPHRRDDHYPEFREPDVVLIRSIQFPMSSSRMFYPMTLDAPNQSNSEFRGLEMKETSARKRHRYTQGGAHGHISEAMAYLGRK